MLVELTNGSCAQGSVSDRFGLPSGYYRPRTMYIPQQSKTPSSSSSSLSRTYIKEKKTPLLSVSHTQGVRIIRFVAIRNRRQKHKRSPINDNSAFFQQLLLSHLMHHTTPTQPPPPPPQNPRSCFICSHYSHNFHNCTSVRVNYTNIYSEN